MSNLFPALLGFSASLALSAVCSTVSFNLFTWFEFGTHLNISQAIAQSSNFPVVYLVGLGFGMVSSVLGGYVASRVAISKPYRVATYAGLVTMVWSAVMFATPTTDVHIGTFALLQYFVVPIPCSLLGAGWYMRNPNDGSPFNR